MKKLILILLILLSANIHAQRIKSGATTNTTDLERRVALLEKNYTDLNTTLSKNIQQLNTEIMNIKSQVLAMAVLIANLTTAQNISTLELQRLSNYQYGTIPLAVKAFPEAEGYGKNATGGRGGTVVKVTNLNNSGVGSFRTAVSAPNRTVVFEVAGYVDLISPVAISDNITIAGQTAFRNGGQGITLRKSASSPFAGNMINGASNLIMRYIRLRSGQRQEGDCCGDIWLGYEENNIIFDHVSASYGSDESIDFSNSTNITFQNCFFSEPLSEVNPPQGGKIFMGKYTDRISIYRTLIANSAQRNPLFEPLIINGVTHHYEYVNNYAFNLGGFGLSVAGEGNSTVNMNIANNYWNEPHASRRWIMLKSQAGSQYYVNNENFDNRYRATNTGTAWNLLTAPENDYANNFSVAQNTIYQRLLPHNTPIIESGVSLIGGLSIWSTLQNEFGANLHRDTADTRVINQIINNNAPSYATGPLSENSFGTAYSALSNMSSVPTDSNNDGIADTWATSNVPAGKTANDTAPNGYPYLENYLNSLTILQ